jgi:hypothetical protein
MVACAILAPARNHDVIPATVAASRVRDHRVVSAVRQQLNCRCGCGGAAVQDSYISDEDINHAKQQAQIRRQGKSVQKLQVIFRRLLVQSRAAPE